MTAKTTSLSFIAAGLLAACAAPQPKPPSQGHLNADSLSAAATPNIPQPVQQSAALPKPAPSAKAETYSVVVKDVDVKELLFALARDAKLNVDVFPGIHGNVTLNAIDQTLPQLLERITKQVPGIRFEQEGSNLVVMPDTPFLRLYKVDYVNMSRKTVDSVAINTQIASISPTAAGASGAAAGGTSGNTSSTKVDSQAENNFWTTLTANIKDLLREEDRTEWERKCETQDAAQPNTGAAQPNTSGGGGAAPGTPAPGSQSGQTPSNSSAGRQQSCGKFVEKATVIANPETGVLSIRATSRQHEKIQHFLDQVLSSARRQVMIEATLVEVRLGQNYQQGIDWQYFNQGAAGRAIGQGGTTRSFSVNPATGAFEATTVNSKLPSAIGNTLFSLAFRRGDFLTAIKLLENFGTLKVISSPKLSVLNNQTAILKVVKNEVYFQVKSDTSQGQTSTLSNLTTTPQSVAVGLVMNVTPQISENNSVLLNVRPTISRITGYKQDPHPSLVIANNVPEIETREMESLMIVNNGDIAVLGGLMQDMVNNNDDAVPGVSKIPLLGNIFTHRNDDNVKTELVIFLRPTVIRNASLQGDFSNFRSNLPDSNFFANPSGLQPVPEFSSGGSAQ